MKNHRILITGGTGSLGTALALRLIENNHIVVLSRNEERQFDLEQKLKLINKKNYTFIIGRVEDENTLESALVDCTTVIHTAAMKDLIYAERNPYECILNNVLASQNLLKTLKRSSTVKILCGISTDKAVAPSTIYGASKLAMESMFMDFANRNPSIITSVARFGNMIDSRGSLVTTWLRNPELLKGISHPECSRFFFKIDEAVNFILDTLSTSETGTINVPLMKKIFIRDLVLKINRESAKNVLGLFPGEKISEKLVAVEEMAFTTLHNDKFVINRNSIQTNANRFSSGSLDSMDSATASTFTSSEIDELLMELASERT